MSAAPLAPTEANIRACAEQLAAGRLVGLPTETVYGLAGDAGSAAAVADIYRIKGRPAGHPLIIHVDGVAAARYWADFGAAGSHALLLARAFWPGPLTLILPRRAQAPAYACGQESTVGLRAPSHPVAQALLCAAAALGCKGVAAPSANRFGLVSPTTAQHVADDLGTDAPSILDGGATPVGIESTIVDLSRGAPVLLRPGAISDRQIGDVLGVEVAASINLANPDQVDIGAPRVPGSLATHYAPRTRLLLVAYADLQKKVTALQADGLHVVSWRDPPDEAARYASQLYGKLRELDAVGADLIVLAAPRHDDRWSAVWDRLTRASAW